MFFTVFDIDSAIALHNSHQRKSCTREQLSFLSALSPQHAIALSCANELLSKASQLGMMETNSAQLPDQLREQLLNDDFVAVRASLNALRCEMDMQALHDWYSEQQRRLGSPDLWPQLMAQPRAKLVGKAILALQTQWLNNPHSQFAAHTSYALALMIQYIIPVIKNYLVFASVELRYHRFRVPSTIRQAYQTHLNNEWNKLNTLKQTLCDNLLRRLQLANHTNNLCYDDLIKHTTEWLSSQQLIQQRHGIPPSKRYGLNANTFPLFIKFILSQGNASQQQQLKELKCFIEDDNYTVNSFSGGITLLPKIIASSNLVPKKPVLFPKLFTQHHYRFQFMQKNIWLIANLRMLSVYDLKSQGVNISAQHLLGLEQQLKDAHQELNNIELNGWQKLFESSTKRFRHLWQNYFDTAQQQLLEKKIDLLDKIYSHTQKGVSYELESDTITKILDSITAESGLHMMSQQRIEQFCILKKKLLKHIHKPLEKTITAPENTPDNNPFAAAQKVHPIDESQELDYQQKMLSFFNSIHLFKLDECNFEETFSNLRNITITLSESNNASSKSRVNNLYAKIFDQYLRYSINISSPNAFMTQQNRINRVEDLLQSHAPDFIQQRIKGLRDLRTQHEWFALFIIKCRSYLASCPQQQSTPYLITNSNMFTTKSCRQHEPSSAATVQLIGGQ